MRTLKKILVSFVALVIAASLGFAQAGRGRQSDRPFEFDLVQPEAVPGSLVVLRGNFPITFSVVEGQACPTAIKNGDLKVTVTFFRGEEFHEAPICAVTNDAVSVQTPVTETEMWGAWYDDGVNRFGTPVRVVEQAPVFGLINNGREPKSLPAFSGRLAVGDWVYFSVRATGLGQVLKPAQLGQPAANASSLLADVIVNATVDGGNNDIKVLYAGTDPGSVGGQRIDFAIRPSAAGKKVALRVGGTREEFIPLPGRESK